MLFLCPLVIVLEVSSREAFWCAEELRHFTDLPVAGPLFADAPQGQLKRALESTEKEILRLAKERGVRNLYVLLGEEDMEHIGKKEVLSARETNLIRCLDGRLQKSGIRLAYGNPEKFRKDQERSSGRIRRSWRPVMPSSLSAGRASPAAGTFGKRPSLPEAAESRSLRSSCSLHRRCPEKKRGGRRSG